MTGVPGVLVGFVDHLQARRGESLGQLFGDHIASCHGLGIAGAGPASQSGKKTRKRPCQDLKMTLPGAHTDRS
jgi:hypothetical protein